MEEIRPICIILLPSLVRNNDAIKKGLYILKHSAWKPDQHQELHKLFSHLHLKLENKLSFQATEV